MPSCMRDRSVLLRISSDLPNHAAQFIPGNLCTVSLLQSKSKTDQLVLSNGKETEEELFFWGFHIKLVLYGGDWGSLPLVGCGWASTAWWLLVFMSVRDATCSAIYEVSNAICVAQLVFFLQLMKVKQVTLEYITFLYNNYHIAILLKMKYNLSL